MEYAGNTTEVTVLHEVLQHATLFLYGSFLLFGVISNVYAIYLWRKYEKDCFMSVFGILLANMLVIISLMLDVPSIIYKQWTLGVCLCYLYQILQSVSFDCSIFIVMLLNVQLYCDAKKKCCFGEGLAMSLILLYAVANYIISVYTQQLILSMNTGHCLKQRGLFSLASSFVVCAICFVVSMVSLGVSKYVVFKQNNNKGQWIRNVMISITVYICFLFYLLIKLADLFNVLPLHIPFTMLLLVFPAVCSPVAFIVCYCKGR